MTVQGKQTSTDDTNISKTTGANLPTQTPQDKSQPQEPVGTRVGKEQDVYQEQEKLLSEVKEKYREADLEAEKQVGEALGKEAKSNESKPIPPDVADAGVKEHAQEASDVIKKGGSLELPVSESDLDRGGQSKVGGRRLINKNIIGVSSLAALAIYVGRLIKMAHKHARKVIFRTSSKGEDSTLKGQR